MPSPESTSRRTSTATSRPPRPPASKSRRIAWWVVGGLLLAGLAGGGFLLLQQGKTERLAREQAEYAAAPVMSVESLVQAWRADAKEFDARTKGRALAIEGEVVSVEAVQAAYGGGTIRVVRLRGPDSLEVACWFAESDADQAAALTPGSRVTLVGRWSGEGTSSQELVLRYCQRR